MKNNEMYDLTIDDEIEFCDEIESAAKEEEALVNNRRTSIVKQPFFSVINEHLVEYPTPSNLNYFWGFGSLAGICLMIQIATGIFFSNALYTSC